MNTYYCPRGCNVCDERAAIVTGFECGACGCAMTTDSTRYDEVHERIEAEGIAACEREQMKDDLASIEGALRQFEPKALDAFARVKRRLGELGELPGS